MVSNLIMLNPWKHSRDLELQGHLHLSLTLPLPKPSPRHHRHRDHLPGVLKPDEVGEWDAIDHVKD